MIGHQRIDLIIIMPLWEDWEVFETFLSVFAFYNNSSSSFYFCYK